MGHARFVFGLVMFAGCGRLGFSEETPAPDGGALASPDAMPDGTPATTLACAQPATTAVGSVDAISAFGTARGIAMITSTAGAINGWTYDVQASGALVSVQSNVPLGTSATQQIATAVNGSTMLVASADNMPVTGTTLSAFDGALHSLGTPTSRVGEYAATGPLAPAPNGGFAYLTINGGTDQVDVRLVDATAQDTTGLVKVVDPSENASEPNIIATPHGYAVVYVSSLTTNDLARVQLLDTNLATTVAAVSVNTSTSGPEHPLIRYAPLSDTYLVTWMEKDPTKDGIWIAILDGQLNQIVPGTQIATGYESRVGTDGTGFWVAWADDDSSTFSSASIAANGTVTPYAIQTASGDHWTMVDRFGQPMFVWVSGSAGQNLYVDPKCN